MTMPATIAMGGIMYGSTVTNSMRLRALGTRRCVHTAVGSSRASVRTTVPSASFRLSFSAGQNDGSLNASVTGESAHFLNRVVPPEQERRHVLHRVPRQGEERGEEEQRAQHHDGEGTTFENPVTDGPPTAEPTPWAPWAARRRRAAAWARGNSVMLATVPLACAASQ